MVGRSISHYRIVDQLGSGGMGVVYKAEDTRLHRAVALKFFPAHLANNSEAVKRFEREARAASSLDHPNICTVYEVDETDDGRTFMAMACYDGRTLKDRLTDGALDTGELVDIAAQVSAGLAEAHRKGIVHRDLKPANILITPQGVVKIVDFGLALLTGESRITNPEATAGTPMYMAPEQVTGREVDHRADIWALGALLYEMSLGVPAFAGDYLEAVMYRVVHSEPERLADIEAPLAAIVARCLEKDPARRYQSADEVHDAMIALREPSAGGISDEPATVNLRAPAALAVGAIVLLALVTAGILRFPTDALLGWLSPSPEIRERSVAVLPLRVIDATPEAEAYARGLAEIVSANLTQLEPYSASSFWVVPMSEVLQREVTSADEARKLFGVNYVLDGAVQHDGRNVRLVLTLTDAAKLRQIGTWTGDFSDESALIVQDEAAIQAARMLRMTLPDAARSTIRLVGTADLGANEYYIQARGYLQRFDDSRNVTTAISLLHRALREDPEFVLATAGLAEAHWRMFDATDDVAHADSAREYGRQVERRRNLPAQVYVSLGVVYEGTGRAELALETFRKALQRDPGNIDAHLGRARALAALDRPDEAEAAYLEVIQRKPDYWVGYHDLAVFYYRQGELEKSAEQFRKEIEMTPDNMIAHRNLGGVYYYLGRWDEAERHLRRAIELGPSPGAVSNLATLYFHRGDFEKATELFHRALRTQPNDHRIWGYLGTAHELSGRPDSARIAFRNALEFAERRLTVIPEDASTLASVAMYRTMLGDTKEAERLLDRFSREETMEPLLAYRIGQTYELLGRRDDALQWLNRSLEDGLPSVYIQHNVWLEDLRTDPRLRHYAADTDR